MEKKEAPLALPAPDDNKTNVRTISVHGNTLKMDALGPIVVNSNGNYPNNNQYSRRSWNNNEEASSGLNSCRNPLSDIKLARDDRGGAEKHNAGDQPP